METVVYLCDFFFTNFWHWLGLIIIISTIRGIKIIYKKNDDTGES